MRAANPCSYLFVPAPRPDRVDKALGGGAHAVIVDLEDAVAPSEKDDARAALESWTSTAPYLLRVNSVLTPFGRDDLSVLGRLRRLAGVVLPKVEHPDEVAAAAAAAPGLPVLALIESAAGVLAAPEIARCGVRRLLFGPADYLADIAAPFGSDVLRHPRSCLVVASAAARLPAPIDGPSLSVRDMDVVRDEAIEAKALGFGGKMCIHPAQVPVVNDVFGPTADELSWAERVVAASEAAGGGVFDLDGSMVDEPVVRRARALLEHAGRTDAASPHGA